MGGLIVSSNGAWDHWIVICKRMKLDPISCYVQKLNQNWMNNLNIRTKTIKLSDENIGINIHNPGFGNMF